MLVGSSEYLVGQHFSIIRYYVLLEAILSFQHAVLPLSKISYFREGRVHYKTSEYCGCLFNASFIVKLVSWSEVVFMDTMTFSKASVSTELVRSYLVENMVAIDIKFHMRIIVVNHIFILLWFKRTLRY